MPSAAATGGAVPRQDAGPGRGSADATDIQPQHAASRKDDLSQPMQAMSLKEGVRDQRDKPKRQRKIGELYLEPETKPKCIKDTDRQGMLSVLGINLTLEKEKRKVLFDEVVLHCYGVAHFSICILEGDDVNNFPEIIAMSQLVLEINQYCRVIYNTIMGFFK